MQENTSEQVSDEELIEIWLGSKESTTKQSYRQVIEFFITYNEKPLRQVTLKEVQDFMRLFEKEKPSTWNGRLTVLRSLYILGMRFGLFSFNPQR